MAMLLERTAVVPIISIHEADSAVSLAGALAGDDDQSQGCSAAPEAASCAASLEGFPRCCEGLLMKI